MSHYPQIRFRLPHWGWFLLSAVVLVFGYVGFNLVWLPWHREQQIIRRIESCGGGVLTDTGGPNWLVELLGTDCLKKLKVFDRVISVGLVHAEFTAADIAQLNELANLRWLTLSTRTTSNASVAHLSRMTNLKVLIIFGERAATAKEGITNDGIEELKEALPDCQFN